MDDAPKETRMKVLLTKYKNLIKKLETLDFLQNEIEILPEFDEETASDNLFYFTIVFRDASDGYKQNLKDIIKFKNKKVYTDEQFDKIYDFVGPFLIFIAEKFL